MRKFAVLILSLLCTFAALELVARRGLLLPYNPNADGWWELMWLKRHDQYDSSHAALIIDKFHPILGWTLVENLRGVRLLDSTVNSNSQGVRGLREYPVARGPQRRIVAIGDSYTFGEAVNDDQTFLARLEQRLGGAEVINMAVHGYGTDQMLLKLQVDGRKYQPDFVLLGFYDEDLFRNRLSFRDYQKPHFSLRSGGFAPDNLPILSPEEFKARFHLRILDYFDVFLTKIRDRRLEEENVVRSRALLDLIYAESRSIRATVLQVYLPTADQVIANEAVHPGLFSHGCSQSDVVCVDPTAAMHKFLADQSDKKRYFRYHYAPELHDVIAGEIAQTLARLPPGDRRPGEAPR